MSPLSLSRRDFLKLAALGLAGAANPLRLKVAPASAGILKALWRQAGAVLSADQQYRLHQASLAFLAPSPAEADQMALAIDFIEGRNEAAATMCGPLSIRILKEAELLGQWASVHDFWLMDPDLHTPLIEDTFPPQLYDWFHFDTPFKDHDFAADPLQAGDFVYLFAGPSDTFEHIFVVTRVDAAGRAYTVSNFVIEEGVLIEERMLYDPGQPGVGQVYEWADHDLRNKIGITGGGGYSIWRVVDGASLEFPDDWASRQMRESLDALFARSSGRWYAWIEEVDGRRLFQYNPYERFHPTSTIKVPIALAFYAWLEEQDLDDGYLAEHGLGGRSYSQLLHAMLVDSEEEATEALTEYLVPGRMKARWEGWGLQDTQVSPRRGSSRELRDCFLALWQQQGWISPGHSQDVLELMAEYTVNDDGRLGILKPQLPQIKAIYNKRGSLTSNPMVVADSGILDLGDRAYFFSAHVHGREGSRYEDLEVELDQAVTIFGNYLANILGENRPHFNPPA